MRGVLDEATGKWGIRVNRVEIKAIDPPPTIKEAMEKQMRAERDKRAAILHAEGERQSRILKAEGARQQAILEAQGQQQAAILRADGEAKAIERVFQAVHANNADAKLLAYKYLETLPTLAQGQGNTFWVIPGELTQAIQHLSQAFAPGTQDASPRKRKVRMRPPKRRRLLNFRRATVPVPRRSTPLTWPPSKQPRLSQKPRMKPKQRLLPMRHASGALNREQKTGQYFPEPFSTLILMRGFCHTLR